MKRLWFGILLCGSLLTAGSQQPLARALDLNVNSRYTIESVEISGDCDGCESRFSTSLQSELKRIIGEKFSQSALEDLAGRVRKELHARVVTHRVLRGTTPEHLKVVFEVVQRRTKFDLSVPKFLYHTKQGWSAAIEGTTTVASSSFIFGLVSDGDELPERYAGLLARYENNRVGSQRVRLRFQFESYHQQWNRATLEALDRQSGVPGIYRTRQNFEPTTTIVLASPLTLSVGASFQRFQTQFPAARTETANAVVTTLRYHRRVEDSDANKHDVDAGYSLRAATLVFSSDFVYTRHHWNLSYRFSRGKHELLDQFTAGLLSGRAPLFERYVLGTSSLLRGWNKFDIDPLGSNRLIHNSLEYRYRWFQLFYDTGAIWNSGDSGVSNDTAAPRHSMGIGLRQGSFSLAVAFPIKAGRADPIFMVGMNY